MSVAEGKEASILASRPGPPAVFVGPDPDALIMDAVVRAGAVLAPLEAASAAIWTSLDPTTWRDADAPDSVEWVQLLSAGVENWIASGVLDADRVWTSARGASALTVAEHALALLLAVRRRLVECARATEWQSAIEGVPLRGSTVLIVGCGAIGTALIPMLTSLQVGAIAVTRSGRTVAGATESYPASELRSLWHRADIVVLAAPATPQTNRIIDSRVLEALPRHATLINVARGSLVDTDALVEHLRRGSIAGAGLDVTDPEPLPTGHALWTMDNVLVTPHDANPEIAWKVNVAARVAENLQRYRAGVSLVGTIDLARNY